MASARAQASRVTAAARPEKRAWVGLLARVGLVAKGISYGIVGVLALAVAIGHGGKTTSRQGALAEVALHSYGRVLLIGLALGFAAYALWRLAQAFFEADDDGAGTLKKWGKRAGYLARAAIYAGLTYSTIKIVSGAGAQSQNAKAHRTTAQAFDLPGGRWLVGAAGLCLIGAGLWNGYRGVARNFRKKWDEARMSETERTWATRAGVLGMLARMLVFGLIGVFVVKAARDYDPKDAIGLDGALQKLAGASYGPWLLGVTAAGLVAYGVYCLADARYRRV